MKIQVVNKFPMRWEQGYNDALFRYGVDWVTDPTIDYRDCRIFMWCNEDTLRFLNGVHAGSAAKNIVFIRRYEYYQIPLEQIKWDRVDAVVMVNDALAKGFYDRTGVQPHVIYNGLSMDRWTYRDHNHGSNIAWVGYINKKKNLPLALQIMAALPRSYVLHVAGAVQCLESMEYILWMAENMKVKMSFYGQVEDINGWLDGMDYLLNTSISEGNPNSVNEALAKGIRPVVHNWPGAQEQYRDWTFDSVKSAVRLISGGSYRSPDYRQYAEDHFGLSNFLKFRKLVDEVNNG